MTTKRQNKSKRSLGSLPKGLPQRKGAKSFSDVNPFEVTHKQKRQKHVVHNRPTFKAKSTEQTLESLQRRQTQLRSTLKTSKKSNVFVDRRIGQYDPSMSKDDQMLARLVKERSRQSQRQSKFRLDDDDNDNDRTPLKLTHKGKPLNPNNMKSDVDLMSDDEDDNGNLAAVDTELHFGGGGISAENTADPYGGSANADLSRVYQHRKTELDDLIMRRKILKQEKTQTKEAQLESIEKMDEGFSELEKLLRYRKNEPKPLVRPKRTEEEVGMDDWHKEMKSMMMKPKSKASDRTRTPEEIAKEEAERLHELETRRLARMNGDFEKDDLSDISVDGKKNRKSKAKHKSKKQATHRNPEELTDSEDEADDDDKLEARFTADGLVYLDKEGKVVKKLGDKEEEEDEESDDESKEDDSDDESDESNEEKETKVPLAVGTRISGNYRAAEQYDNQETWHDGVITKVHTFPDGSVKYDLDYDDGDFEEDAIPKNVKVLEKTSEEKEKSDAKTLEEEVLQMKRKKAKEMARCVAFELF
jgi:nucleolar protein 14